MAHLAELPPIHREPFDRLLIAQDMQHQLTLITVDRIFSAYSVHLLENR
jgi:PIN domain nuclease of toxin-antitoxin system